MDSLTQICLGAAVGEAYLGKKIGNKAILWGAILGTVPDLDVIFKPLFPFVEGLVMHRGVSHSILFFIFSSFGFSWLIGKTHKNAASFKEWYWFSFWVMFTHAVLDSFTSWGTQLFWPHPVRIAWNNIFVADLAYTIPLIVCLIWLMFKKRDSSIRRKLNTVGLAISSLYMIFTFVNKGVAGSVFSDSLESNNIEFSDFSTRPTPLNSIMWDAVVESEDSFYLGTYTLLAENENVNWKKFPKNHELMSAYKDQSDWHKLQHFTGGEYVVEQREDTLKIHDLRFGKMQFPNGDTDWVFTFYGIPQKDGTISFSQKELPSERFSGDEMKMIFSELYAAVLGRKPIN